jgi:hypothetical protein
LFGGYAAVGQVAPEGKFLSLNGIDQCFTVPNFPGINIGYDEEMTISCRIRAANFDAQYTILSKGNLNQPGGRYDLATYNFGFSTNLAFNLRNSENTSLGAPYATQLGTGKWVHIAWVYNIHDHTSRLYLDGKILHISAHSEIGRKKIENTYDLLVGCGWMDASHPVKYQFWSGQFDELRVWKRALTEAEVSEDMTAAKAQVNGLVAAFDFENISENKVPNLTGKGPDGQLYGYGILSLKTELPVGIGEVNERLTGFRILTNSMNEYIKSITIDLSGTTSLADISSIKVYFNGASERLNLNTASPFGSQIPINNKLVIQGNKKLDFGYNYIWVTADISSKAKEGNFVTASVISYTTGDGSVASVSKSSGNRAIVLVNKLLFSGGDGGSRSYRIPAVATAKDGSLVVATDKRWDNNADLPGNIDVVIRRSTDQGKTWSTPVTIAGEYTDQGYGDPALVVNRKNGEIICLFAGIRGFFGSKDIDPITINLSKSVDNGKTWSKPIDITSQIYGSGCLHPVRKNWQGAFVSSGAAIQLKDGRLMAGLAVREKKTRLITNYVIFSDDNGLTWDVSPYSASNNGNEASLAELENGYVLMSIRTQGTRMFNISMDRGISWGIPYAQTAIIDPSCNGDLMRYTDLSEGKDKNRLLHSIPYSSSRKNVSVLLSYDEGESWPVRKTIYPGLSAYSSLTVLKDGTIGLYYEVGEYENYQLYFVRFSLDWLTNNQDFSTDQWISNVDNEEIIAENSLFTVFPNPTNNILVVSGPFKTSSLVEIYNTQGILQYSTTIESANDKIQLSVQGYVPGIYFLKIDGITTKFVVR